MTIYIFVLLAFVAVGSMGIGALLAFIEKQPPLEQLENYDPPEVTRIYDRTGTTQLAEYYSKERRELVNIEDVPEHLKNAIISIEDERFYSHFGVDPQGLLRVLFVNISRGRRAQGASTITMQVARNLVLETRVKTYARKIMEILVAIQIERKYSKDQILQFYMNHIFLGANSYGFKAAARTYFNKDIKDLNITESAMLAGLPQAPSQLSPFRKPDACRDRRNIVLGNMARLRFIEGGEELKRMQDSPLGLNPAPFMRTKVPYFVDYVRKYMLANDKDGEDLNSKGYTVISTVDLRLQKIVEEELSRGLRNIERLIEEQKSGRNKRGPIVKGQIRLATVKSLEGKKLTVALEGRSAEINIKSEMPFFDQQRVLRPGNLVDVIVQDVSKDKLTLTLLSHVQGAAVLLDVKSGEILALVGGDDFEDKANNGEWNRAVQGGRQPGSCWKPLLYGAALDLLDEKGKPRFTLGTMLDDSPLDINGYQPKNYEGRYYGPTSLYEALVKSRNIPTIRLFMAIGPKVAVPLYEKYNMVTKNRWKLDPVPSMPLGTPDVTPLELAAAYSVFSNGGKGLSPIPVKRYYSAKNPNDSRVVKPVEAKVLSPEAAYMTTRILRDVVARGTGANTVGTWAKSRNKDIPQVAGKTGTTNDCYVAWFTGFTPDLVLAVYVGFDQQCSMGTRITGGTAVGPIWAPMMDRILQIRDDWTKEFEKPAGILEMTICSTSGKLVGSNCEAYGHKITSGVSFRAGMQPTETCDYGPINSNDTGSEEAYQQDALSGGNQQEVEPQRGFFSFW